MPSSMEKKLKSKKMQLLLNPSSTKIRVTAFNIASRLDEARRMNLILESIKVFKVLAIAKTCSFSFKLLRIL